MENGNSRGPKRFLYNIAIWTSPVRFEVHRRGEHPISYPTFGEAEEAAFGVAISPEKSDYDFYSVHSLFGREYRHDLIIRL